MVNKETVFKDFINKYSIQKTLRFALNPIGETAKNLKEKELLEKDEELAEKYKKAKKIIDEYHKWYINEQLSKLTLSEENLEKFSAVYSEIKKDKTNEKAKKDFLGIQNNLRKDISSAFNTKDLFDKKFILDTLPEWIENNKLEIEGVENTMDIIREFEKWTSYFSGFNENRKNIYTSKSQSTSIGHRLIHENLPKFLENINKYKKAKEVGVDFSEVEKYFQIKLDDIFKLSYFSQCLTQKGIDMYNLFREGQSIESGKERNKGVNEVVNLEMQQYQYKKAKANDEDKKENDKKITALKSCKIEELHKQILCDSESFSFRPESVKNDGDLCTKIKRVFTFENGKFIINKENINIETGELEEIRYNISEQLEEIMRHIDSADADKIYIRNNIAITSISKFIFGDWAIIKNSLEEYAENILFPKTTKKEANNRAKWLKKNYFTFEEIHSSLEKYFEQYSDEEISNNDTKGGGITLEMKKLGNSKPLFDYFKNISIQKAKNETTEKINLLQEIEKNYKPAADILEKNADSEREQIKGKKEEVTKIKKYLDAIMDLQNFLKPLYLVKKESEKDNILNEKDGSFYTDFETLYNAITQITPMYNLTRNHFTKKLFNPEKYKLNFENSTLGAGWDRNKETANTCVLFIKENKYYLGVMPIKHNKLFEKEIPTDTQSNYQKIVYKLLPGASKMLPKVFFSDKNISYYSPSPEILEIRNHSSHTKNGDAQKGYSKKDFSLEDCHKMIDFFKKSLNKHSDWKEFDFKFKPTQEYSDISEFYRAVEHQGYKVTFQDVSDKYIEECVQNGKLYLFEIYSKDFSANSKGKPNLQTLYWKELFSPENLKNVVYKLNGEAELFYRKASLKYSDDVWKNGHHRDDPKKKQKHPIIKDRRYAVDTFLFHVPITGNFKAEGIAKYNDEVNNFLKENSDVNIIGLDRGERHLIYLTLTNQKGEIMKDEDGNSIQMSLNQFGKTDYQKKLDTLEHDRAEARKSWGVIGKIKDMKEGYLSLVVHRISQLIIKYNAIVVLEDLNFGFKRGRFKVEKQIYQKLEKMLIDKLNFLVIKDKKNGEAGSVQKALQLTAPFESFEKIGKQTGIIYYVPAYHTSKICPATGFVNLLYPKYETIQKSKDFFEKFESIRYNTSEHHFEFGIDYSKFTAKAEGSKQKWTICTVGDRLVNKRDSKKNNSWTTHSVILNDDIRALFEDNNIDFSSGKDLKAKIISQEKSAFFSELIYLLKLTLQMRNSETGTDVDWMISPVKDKNGKFFCTKNIKEADKNLPLNADANGAYHIALKGLWCLQQMKNWEKGNKLNLAISNKEWYKFAQEK